MTAHSDAIDWMAVGTASSVSALVLRFAVVQNGLHEQMSSASDDAWFLVDDAGRLIDCGSPHAAPLLGAPITQVVGGLAAGELGGAWYQVMRGRSQTVRPWNGGRARVATRVIEMHPLRDLLNDGIPVIGALVRVVDHQADAQSSLVA